MFYADTALPATTALMCGYKFFGADHLLFGTDMPYGPQLGDRAIRHSRNAVEQMDINDVEKQQIFEDNAKKLLHLTI